jgi:spoIIIJ-associated protein
MDWIEVTARSVDEAKELALDRLGVVEDELEFELLDEPRKGVFGIGRTEARIRARVKPISREKPADRRRRRSGAKERSGRGGSSGGQGGGRSRSRTPGGGQNGDDKSRPPKPQKPANPDSGSAPNAGAAKASADEGTVSRSSSGNRRRRGGRGRGGSGGGAGGGAQNGKAAAVEGGGVDRTPVTQPDVKQPAEDDVDTLPIEDQAEHAAAFAKDLVRTMGFTASIRTEIDDDDLTVHIDGQNLGALVGPRGATLQALEEVVRAVVQHHAGGHSAWVHVDVGGYKARRREALEDFARKMATEVAETGAARRLEPMSAADRKVVHDVITDLDGVVTASEGEDPRRRVVIRPA